MENTKIISLLSLLCILILGSCEDNRMEKVVEDKVYILHSGFQNVEMDNIADYAYNFYIIKSGVGKLETDVELVVNDVLLEDYNLANGTDYKLLPDQYYTIKNKSLHVGKNDYRIPFEIAFKAMDIAALESQSEQKYALPCEIKVLNSAIPVDSAVVPYSIILPSINE